MELALCLVVLRAGGGARAARGHLDATGGAGRAEPAAERHGAAAGVGETERWRGGHTVDVFFRLQQLMDLLFGPALTDIGKSSKRFQGRRRWKHGPRAGGCADAEHRLGDRAGETFAPGLASFRGLTAPPARGCVGKKSELPGAGAHQRESDRAAGRAAVDRMGEYSDDDFDDEDHIERVPFLCNGWGDRLSTKLCFIRSGYISFPLLSFLPPERPVLSTCRATTRVTKVRDAAEQAGQPQQSIQQHGSTRARTWARCPRSVDTGTRYAMIRTT